MCYKFANKIHPDCCVSHASQFLKLEIRVGKASWRHIHALVRRMGNPQLPALKAGVDLFVIELQFLWF